MATDLQYILLNGLPDPRRFDAAEAAACELMFTIELDFLPDRQKEVSLSGSVAKGTNIKGGSDIDLFISVGAVPGEALRDIASDLMAWAQRRDLAPRAQNVSIGTKYKGFEVDLTPGRRQNPGTDDHSLFVRRRNSWTKTNVAEHIDFVRGSGSQSEIRLAKLWRDHRNIDLPSFLLELAVIRALSNGRGTLEANFARALHYLATDFADARLVDPSNSANVVSEELSRAEKIVIAKHASADARSAYSGHWWSVFG